jgi:hypothetical protein
MNPPALGQRVLGALTSARLVADHAERLGIGAISTIDREPESHLGAVLADSVLQAGLNYRTVVKVRVDRIKFLFPQTAQLPGILEVINKGQVSDLLLWRHSTKIDRFIRFAAFLGRHQLEDVCRLREWLQRRDCRDHLMSVNGIGPKTVDYLCCLVGLDCIAVDRHIRAFASAAGVPTTDYEALKTIISFAADLLGISRRNFDAWIWRHSSRRQPQRQVQYELLAGAAHTGLPKAAERK